MSSDLIGAFYRVSDDVPRRVGPIVPTIVIRPWHRGYFGRLATADGLAPLVLLRERTSKSWDRLWVAGRWFDVADLSLTLRMGRDRRRELQLTDGRGETTLEYSAAPLSARAQRLHFLEDDETSDHGRWLWDVLGRTSSGAPEAGTHVEFVDAGIALFVSRLLGRFPGADIVFSEFSTSADTTCWDGFLGEMIVRAAQDERSGGGPFEGLDGFLDHQSGTAGQAVAELIRMARRDADVAPPVPRKERGTPSKRSTAGPRGPAAGQ